MDSGFLTRRKQSVATKFEDLGIGDARIAASVGLRESSHGIHVISGSTLKADSERLVRGTDPTFTAPTRSAATSL